MSTRKVYTIRKQGTNYNGDPYDVTLEPLADKDAMLWIYRSALRSTDWHNVQFIERTIVEADQILEQEFKYE